MSGQTHKNNERLKALLDQKKNQEQPGDGFEKEALEGFAMLQNDAEALDLKAELDTRMKQVLTKKTSSTRTYWLAAAGLALVVSLSVYLVLMQDTSFKKDQALAIAAETVKDTAPAPPVAESSYERKAAEFKGIEPQQIAAKKEKPKAEAQPASPLQASVGPEPAKDLKAENSQTEIASGNAAPPAKTAEEEPSKSEANLELAASDKNAYAERKEPAMDEKNKSPETRAKKAESAKPMAGLASPSASLTKGQLADSTSVSNCYYEGGETALYKELTAQLVKKELDKHFSATLFLNTSGKVLRVKFIKTDGMSKREQSEITVVLQMLDKFRFRGKLSGTEGCEYRISR